MAGVRNYSRKGIFDGFPYVYESHFENSNNSGRHPLTGELVLQPQAYSLDHRYLTYRGTIPGPTGRFWPAHLLDTSRATGIATESSVADNKAIVKFYSQLSQGRAGLGVTLAQFGQTRGMVIDRFRKIENTLDRVRQRAIRKRKRITLETAASDVLEAEFGWVPLISEIYALSATAFAMAIPPIKVTGRGSESFRHTFVADGNPSYTDFVQGKRKCCVDAFISIENPNLWLADRLGVINPAVVAWDAVPWSFVINFFSNTNAYMSQFTNLVGLRVNRISTTRSCVYLRESTMGNLGGLGYHPMNMLRRYKRRTVGSIPTVELQLRIPSMSWETVLIAASLVTQKARRIVNAIY